MLTWADGNLERHAAKHVLGSATEAWEEPFPSPDDVRTCRRHAAEAGCEPADHPRACRDAAACGAAARRVTEDYRRATDAEWAFAQRHGLYVDVRDRGGIDRTATGPRGIFMAAVASGDGHVAKTAYRSDADATGGRTRSSVVRLRRIAAACVDGLSRNQLIALETLLLTGRPSTTDRHVRELYTALTAAPEPDRR